MSDPLSSTRMELEHRNGAWMYCHDELTCRGDYCTLHNRSDHAMRSFPQLWRSDRGIMERTCPHGVGHPDPDEYAVRTGKDDGVHGCDMCCGDSVTVPLQDSSAPPRLQGDGDGK